LLLNPGWRVRVGDIDFAAAPGVADRAIHQGVWRIDPLDSKRK
jgi:hypothetical protein